ncbi:DUF2142 domain-containing protein [Nocardia sp. NPDC051832]|uniref:DUF2142 domain-containing protein n=1 Tax=Nocardia sp. NPDC051832 TaxID=3155673 RepID=UPI00344A76B6
MTTSADRTESNEAGVATNGAAAETDSADAERVRTMVGTMVGAEETGRARRIAGSIVHRFGAATVVFAVLATIFGAAFAVSTPPFWGHDEITQFGRAYQVAHGGFLPEEIPDTRGVSYGGQVPTSITELMGYALKDYTSNPQEPDPMVYDPADYDRFKRAAVSADQEPVWFTNTAAYSPVPYIPAAAGIRIAELLDLKVGGMIMATRLAGLAVYLALVGFALWALRRHRVQWLVFAVALLPIAVFQAGTVTADTMTNALAIMVSALLVKALFLGDRLGRTETAAILAAAILLPLSKPTYVLLAMLLVLIPVRRFAFGSAEPRRWQRFVPWAFAGVGAICFALWTKIAGPTTKGMGLMRPEHQWNSVRPADQLSGILGDPLAFIDVFGDSIVYRDQRWFIQFFGELGFAYIDVPALSIVACLLALAVAIGIADRMTASTRWRTWTVALIVAASVAMIYVTLYMSFTPVGYYIIDGVQGRYFVPLAIIAFGVLLRWMPLRLTDTEGRTPTLGPAVTIAAASTIGLIAALAKYHSIVWG